MDNIQYINEYFIQEDKYQCKKKKKCIINFKTHANNINMHSIYANTITIIINSIR